MDDPTNSRQKTDDEIRRLYGENAVIGRKGKFTIIHLDSTTPEEVADREAAFEPDSSFVEGCPLCESARDEDGYLSFDVPGTEDPDNP